MVVIVPQPAAPLGVIWPQTTIGIPKQEEVDVVHFLSELAGGRLAVCHTIILTNVAASLHLHNILLGLQQTMTNTFFIYDVETYLRSSLPSVPLLRHRPPKSDGTYCVAYYIFSSLSLLATALSAIPKTDWFRGATRYFVYYTNSDGKNLDIRTLEEEPSLLFSYNTIYITHNPQHNPKDPRSWPLNLLSNCPFCRSGEPEVILRTRWSPSRGFQTESDIFPDLFHDCNGHIFRAVTMNFPPFILYSSGNSTHPLKMEDCLDKRIIDIIAQVHNFTYEVYEPVDRRWGYRLDNGTFLGVLGEVQNYLKDFTLDVSMTPERAEVIDYTVGYHLEPLTFVTSKPQPLPQWLALVRPYQSYVWLSFLLMLTASGPTYWLLQKLSGSSQSLPGALFLMYATMFTQARSWPPSFAVRVYAAFWLLFCLVATVSYVSNLTAFLTVPALSSTVDGLEELIDSNFVWGINNYSASDYMLFKSSKAPLYQEIFQGLTFCPSLVECVQRVLDERFAFISFQTYLRDAIATHFIDKNGDTQVYLAKERFFQTDTAYAMQKGSPIKAS
ncbi:glutamate receptor ionotropic, delta-2-like [Homarus americanus]|uniref:glutamate receptor ionotropic, delta-2-like n=1 Tax=Homarus americanus TaxID=6706 RepID=UPI001C44D287|nr:glutamate receptor ionotropic, delta-2-like [Homarus americanus]